MEAGRLGFFARLWMMIWLPWKVLFQPEAAWRIRRSLEGEAPPRIEPAAVVEPPKAPAIEAPKPSNAAAIHLLSILQRDGRLIDFLQEEIASATDDQVGAAARIVHEGCRKALAQYVTLAPIRTEEEGAPVLVVAGFDPAELRLTGNVSGPPPFKGRLAHPGWRAAEVRIPTFAPGQDPEVIAPAEVEV